MEVSVGSWFLYWNKVQDWEDKNSDEFWDWICPWLPALLLQTSLQKCTKAVWTGRIHYALIAHALKGSTNCHSKLTALRFLTFPLRCSQPGYCLPLPPTSCDPFHLQRAGNSACVSLAITYTTVARFAYSWLQGHAQHPHVPWPHPEPTHFYIGTLGDSFL